MNVGPMLGPRERRILARFVDAMIPPGTEGLGPSGIEADVPAKIERQLASFPPGPRFMLPFALWAIELYPLALGPGLRPFSSLSRSERTRALERLEHHVFYPLRSAYLAIKLLAFLFWAEHPTVARATHWGQGCG